MSVNRLWLNTSSEDKLLPGATAALSIGDFTLQGDICMSRAKVVIYLPVSSYYTSSGIVLAADIVWISGNHCSHPRGCGHVVLYLIKLCPLIPPSHHRNHDFPPIMSTHPHHPAIISTHYFSVTSTRDPPHHEHLSPPHDQHPSPAPLHHLPSPAPMTSPSQAPVIPSITSTYHLLITITCHLPMTSIHDLPITITCHLPMTSTHDLPITITCHLPMTNTHDFPITITCYLPTTSPSPAPMTSPSRAPVIPSIMSTYHLLITITCHLPMTSTHDLPMTITCHLSMTSPSPAPMISPS
ncbi:hypothetical protein Q9966_013956 [Columba livia]|nr:hypothetical protein Q9966_013956 [Columba livia]